MRFWLNTMRDTYILTRPRCAWQVSAADKLEAVVARWAFNEGAGGSPSLGSSDSTSRRCPRRTGEGRSMLLGIGEAIGKGRGVVLAGPIAHAVQTAYAVDASCHKDCVH